MKQKRSVEGGMWWIMVGAIVAIIAGGLIIFAIKNGIFVGGKNVESLSSCKNQAGACRSACLPDEKGFYKLGCPFDANNNGKIDDNEKGDTCCIKSNDA